MRILERIMPPPTSTELYCLSRRKYHLCGARFQWYYKIWANGPAISAAECTQTNKNIAVKIDGQKDFIFMMRSLSTWYQHYNNWILNYLGPFFFINHCEIFLERIWSIHVPLLKMAYVTNTESIRTLFDFTKKHEEAVNVQYGIVNFLNPVYGFKYVPFIRTREGKKNGKLSGIITIGLLWICFVCVEREWIWLIIFM